NRRARNHRPEPTPGECRRDACHASRRPGPHRSRLQSLDNCRLPRMVRAPRWASGTVTPATVLVAPARESAWMTRKLPIVGGPGDGIVVAEAALLAGSAGAAYSLAGFLNDSLPRGTIIHGVPVLGRFEDWAELSEEHVFCPAVQKVREMPYRVHRLEGLGI